MSRNQFLASTYTLRTLLFVTLGICSIGIVKSAMGQNDSNPGERTPPPPTASDTALAPGDVIEGANQLGYEELAQGPIHEAFAIDAGPTVDFRVAPEKPPADVREQPPEDRPDGENLLWIPGYWFWHDEDGEYIWVSGLFRRVPPGRTWVPGYWSEEGAGYRWTSGYWTGAGVRVDDQVYLPAPPQSIDNGPSIPPPGDEYFWLPGSWEYGNGDYRWRGGYWTRHYEGWVWQPACYITTPRGYVYNPGYWDLLPTERGMLYSPVQFYRPVYLDPRFVYRPRLRLGQTAALLLNLFVRPGHPGFFYGNYYGPSYAALGYQPWFDLGYGYGGRGSRFAAPWLAYYDWNYGRRGIDFRTSMGRYKNYYHKAGRVGPGSLKVESNVVKFAEKGNKDRGPQEKPANVSLDDVVLRDFEGQAPPRIERRSGGKSSKNQEGDFSAAKTKSNFEVRPDSDRGLAPPKPAKSSINQSIPNVPAENQGKKMQRASNPSRDLDRGRPQPSIEDPKATRGPDATGGQGRGKSSGGGKKNSSGGGGQGKGGGKK